MSYLSQTQDPRRRAAAIAGTVAIHTALAVAVVTGLTITGVTPVPDYIPIIEFKKKDPEPVPPPPDPQPKQQAQPQTAPQTEIQLIPTPDTRVDVVDPDAIVSDPIVWPDPPRLEPPRPQPARFTPQAARPANRQSNWITNDDYPRRPLIDQAEGTARYRLIIGTNGRVSSCELTASTGNPQLDAATCNLITRRARFESATDENGAKVLGSYTGTVRWNIPD